MLIQPDRMIRKAGRRCVRLHRMRILVVEDEVDLAHTLRTGLTAEGCSVDLAHDGRTGPVDGPDRRIRPCRTGLDARQGASGFQGLPRGQEVAGEDVPEDRPQRQDTGRK